MGGCGEGRECDGKERAKGVSEGGVERVRLGRGASV